MKFAKGNIPWNKNLTAEMDDRILAGKRNPMYGAHPTEETNEKNRQAHIGQIPWNKNLTKETDERVAAHAEKRKGKNNPFYNKRHTEDTKKRMSISTEGKNHPMYRKHHSEETKRKQSEAKIGEKHPMYGKHRSEETKRKISESNRGKIVSEETREKMRGKNHPNYKDGSAPLGVCVRNLSEYNNWRTAVFKRDKFTCQDCDDNKGGNLHAHHTLVAFKKLFKQFLSEYDQFSPIEDKETLLRLAMKYTPFREAEGITLCKKCHKERHSEKKIREVDVSAVE